MKHIMLVNAVHKEQMRMATVDENGLLFLHCDGVFLAAGLPEVVCLGERVAGETLGDTHHALLVHHEAEGVVQQFAGLGMEVLGCLAVVLVGDGACD